MRDHDALHGFVASRQAMPFGWWTNDCVTFGAAAVKAQTGVDHLAEIKTWNSMRGAARELKRRGGFVEAVSSRLTEIPCAYAKRGDIALVEGLAFSALMVVEGDMLVGPGIEGLVRVPRAAMKIAWSADA
jgi:hypothetical protein